MIDVSSILVNDVIDKFCSNSASPFVTDTQSILTNDKIENIDSILASSFETYALTNSGLSTPLLFPFSNTLLPFAFNCVTRCSSIKFISNPVFFTSDFPFPRLYPNISPKTCFPYEIFLIFPFREFSGTNFPSKSFTIGLFPKVFNMHSFMLVYVVVLVNTNGV